MFFREFWEFWGFGGDYGGRRYLGRGWREGGFIPLVMKV